MSRRRAVWLALVVLCLAAVAGVAFDPAARIEGWVGGEPFYDGRSATAWRRDLRVPDGPRPTAALDALAAGKADAVPVCVWLLRSAPEPETRWRAADALGRMGRAGSAAGPDLVAALSDPDPLVRGVAVRAIGEAAPDVSGGVSALVTLFPDVEAIRAVSRFGPAAGGAVPRLTELLGHDDPIVRWQAARALGKIGERAAPSVPALARLTVSDREPLVREHAAEALGDIGPAAAAGVPALVRALGDPIARVRRDAVRALGQMGPAAGDAIGDVRRAGGDPDPDVRIAATRALRQIDPAAKKD